MRHPTKYLVGLRFGMLVIVRQLGRDKVECRCDCGSLKEMYKGNLKESGTLSCGCTARGKLATPTYSAGLLEKAWR